MVMNALFLVQPPKYIGIMFQKSCHALELLIVGTLVIANLATCFLEVVGEPVMFVHAKASFVNLKAVVVYLVESVAAE